MDVLHHRRYDLSLEKVHASKEFQVILASPPCATFSRAAGANLRGLSPVRSYDWPRGCEKLTAAQRDRAILLYLVTFSLAFPFRWRS